MARMEQVGLVLHPDKTKIVYCRDNHRRGTFGCTSFTFLGYTFRSRPSRDRQGRKFLAFLPAISADALKRIGGVVRHWRLRRRIFHTWKNSPRRSTRSWWAGCSTTAGPSCIASWRASTPTWCDGSATSIDDTRASGQLGSTSPNSPRQLPPYSRSENGCARLVTRVTRAR